MLVKKLVRIICTPFIDFADYFFLYSIAMIIFGGFGYVLLSHFTLIRAYEMHYDLILAINDPFVNSLSYSGKIFGMVDTFSAFLILPSIISIILARSYDESKSWDNLTKTLEEFVLEAVENSDLTKDQRDNLQKQVNKFFKNKFNEKLDN